MKRNNEIGLRYSIIWKAILILFIIFALVKKPICHFSEQQVTIVEPTECELIERHNLFSTETEVPQLYIGTSMYPFIKPNQICLCEAVDKYKIGDVVSFYTRYNGKLMFIAHRIVDMLPTGEIITKGDNNEVTDYNTISKEQIFCKIKEETLLQSLIREWFE